MRITDLKLNQEVNFHGFNYQFKGTEMRKDNTSKIECFVFYSDDLKSEKLLHKHSVLKHDMKVKDGKIIY